MGVTIKGLGVPGTGLKLWLDAGVLATGAVALWPDLSGNGNHATQTTGANQPTCVANVVNGHAVVRFNGTSNFLSIANILGSRLFSTNTATLFIVGRSNSPANRGSFIQWNPGVNTNWVNVHLPWSDGVLYWDFGHISSGGRVTIAMPAGWLDAFHATTLWRNSTTGQIYADGSQLASSGMTDALDNTITANFVVGSNSNDSAFLNGDIAEIIIYNRALLTSERQSVERYLANKYNIALS